MNCEASNRLKPYTHIVHSEALRLLRRVPVNVQYDDLRQAGLIAVHLSLGRFDPSKGASEETFLRNRIRGAMLDELRSLDWFPRRAKKSERAVVKEMICVGAEHEELVENHLWSRTDPKDEPPGIFETKQRVQFVVDAFERLDHDEQQMLQLMYDDEIPAKYLGEIEGISESAICQRRKKVLEKLAKKVFQIEMDAMISGAIKDPARALKTEYNYCRRFS